MLHVTTRPRPKAELGVGQPFECEDPHRDALDVVTTSGPEAFTPSQTEASILSRAGCGRR